MRSALMVLLFVVCSWGLLAKSSQKPNIIIVYVDDMGIGDVSCFGGEVEATPNIDKLAKEGKMFTQYYTNAPVCSPSRVAITTGMYPLKWNINTFLSSKKHNDICDQSGFLKSEAPTMAKMLKSVGYHTAHFGKWHMGGGRDVVAPSIIDYGFDEYSSTWESPDPDPLLTSSNWIWAATDSIKRWERTAYFVDKTLDFLKRKGDEPCFINLWPDDVHSPWVPDEESQIDWKKTAFTMPKLKPVISEMDKEIGRLMEGINKLGLAEKTLVVFTSDNGPAPTFDYDRTNGMRGSKNSLYEGGINMPFIVHWPGVIKAGQVDEESIISAVDLFPTLCKIAGGKMPFNQPFDSEDVSKSFLSKKSHKRNGNIYWEYARFNPKMSKPKVEHDVSLPLAIRKENWKFFTTVEGDKVELYDLSNDPNEMQNIAEFHTQFVDQLKKEALDWFNKNNEACIQ